LGSPADAPDPAAEEPPAVESGTGERVAWLSGWVEGHAAASKGDYEGAVEKFIELEQTHLANNYEVLVCIAEWQWKQGRLAPSMLAFEKARAANPLNLNKMDVFAGMLVSQGQEAPLNALASSLLQINKGRPEPWVAAARLCQLRGENELERKGLPTTLTTGVQYAEKALQLAPDNIEAELALGALLLLMGESDRAEQGYRRVYLKGKTYQAYRGLISSYLKMNDLESALRTASEAYQANQKVPQKFQNPRILVLFGMVCRRFDQGNEKAKVLFQNALILDPLCSDALLSLADLHCSEKNASPAIALLKKNLHCIRPDIANATLGTCYMMQNKHADAIAYFDLALKSNPESYQAISGHKKASKLLDGGSDDDDGDGNDESVNSSPASPSTP
jgi:anaphase-promoting complex subunit 3